MLARAALVVEANDILGDARRVVDDEADAQNEFARMSFDLCDDTARLRPASRLIVDVRIRAPDMVRRTTNRTYQEVSSTLLQNTLPGQPDRILDPFGFEILVDRGICEARVGAAINAGHLALVARHDRLQHALPAIGAMDIARTQRAPLQIAELIEDEQRMIARAIIVTVPDAVFLLAMRRADALIHVEQVPRGGRRA